MKTAKFGKPLKMTFEVFTLSLVGFSDACILSYVAKVSCKHFLWAYRTSSLASERERCVYMEETKCLFVFLILINVILEYCRLTLYKNYVYVTHTIQWKPAHHNCSRLTEHVAACHFVSWFNKGKLVPYVSSCSITIIS